MVCAGVFLLPVAEKGVSLKMAFLQCSLDALYRSTRAFLQRSFDIP